MAQVSAFIADRPSERYRGEFRYYVIYGALLTLSAFTLLSLPIFRAGAVLAFVASWLLFVVSLLAIVRPIVYRRGLPDAVSGLICAFFYGFVGYISGGTNLLYIEGYRLAICAVLLFMGFSRLLVFSRMITVASMPMLLFCFAADVVSGVLLLWGFPSSNASTIYWYAGMILLIDGLESILEAVTLNRYIQKAIE